MDKVKVMSIFGTRPEATKMAPLIKAMDKCDDIEQVVCVTAQTDSYKHYCKSSYRSWRSNEGL